MSRKSRFILVAFLSIVIATSFTGFAYAGNSEKAPTVPAASDNINDGIAAELLRITNVGEKKLYGLGDIDLSTVEVGAPISVYESAGGELKELDFRYYPLSSNNVLIALAIKVEGWDHISITTELADEIDSHVTPSESFALVYGYSSCNIITKDAVSKILDCDTLDSSRDRIKEGKATSKDFSASVTMHSFAPIQSLEYEKAKSQISAGKGTAAQAASSSTNYVSVPVAFVSQQLSSGESNLCWAASVACIGNYLTSGINYSATGIAKSLRPSGEYNLGATMEQAIGRLSAVYGISYATHPTTAPSVSTLHGKINGGRPVYARWTPPAGSDMPNHATVISGADTAYNIVTLMNPSTGFMSGALNGNKIQYVSASGARVYTLIGYAA